ncbi:MAG: YceD family protein [Arachnia sp.]
MSLGVIGVPQDSEVELDLTLQSVSEGVLASGTAFVQLRGQCARCLDDIEDEGSYDLQELYFYPGNEVDEEESVVEDDAIDLEEALRDAVVLELPFTPLCEEDCLGLCPDCGFNRNLDPAHGHGEQVDPRWSKLTDLAGDTNN